MPTRWSLDPGATDVSGVNTVEVTPAESTTYTLSATNPFGTTTAEVTVSVIGEQVPAFRFLASSEGNLDNSWVDEIEARTWNLTGP